MSEYIIVFRSEDGDLELELSGGKIQVFDDPETAMEYAKLTSLMEMDFQVLEIEI